MTVRTFLCIPGILLFAAPLQSDVTRGEPWSRRFLPIKPGEEIRLENSAGRTVRISAGDWIQIGRERLLPVQIRSDQSATFHLAFGHDGIRLHGFGFTGVPHVMRHRFYLLKGHPRTGDSWDLGGSHSERSPWGKEVVTQFSGKAAVVGSETYEAKGRRVRAWTIRIETRWRDWTRRTELTLAEGVGVIRMRDPERSEAYGVFRLEE